ncbi:hypothetical protein FK220_015775 [Flavobacteriaceae bacterium TP-CH-4]|uniref:Uncharacterized protein n=1 Tax=Pelagihabitans pacificus TaxID=2696054 RepID=A0A967E810_9FLAO|nr:DUF6747 family protein [Pelagihabitans pacificus]NHF60814.1 hypothetical protein [Pelagihabitans pacificus]
MGTLLHFRNLYEQAFEDCKPQVAVILLKIYSVFAAFMLFMAVYALMDRALNGFEF